MTIRRRAALACFFVFPARPVDPAIAFRVRGLNVNKGETSGVSAVIAI